MPIETKLMQDFRAARAAGAPLVAIETADAPSAFKQINLASKPCPMIAWDRAAGFTSKNPEGEAVLEEVIGPNQDDWAAINEPETALRKVLEFPGNKDPGLKAKHLEGTILFFMNGHRFLNPQEYPEAMTVMQALCNARDELKTDKRMVVFIVPSMLLTEEIRHSFVVLEDPLPTAEELERIAVAVYKAAQYPEPKTEAEKEERKKELKDVVEGVRGLSPFSAETAIAMSCRKTGIDLNRLFDKKRKIIEDANLELWKGGETFADVEGVVALKDFMTMVMNGEDAPTVWLFWDELEKAFAGIQGDSSGTSQKMHGVVLSWMADNDIPAIRYVGHPGCSKSYISKAVAGQFKRPLIVMNIAKLESKYVGESTQQLVAALKTALAIGRPGVMATCNKEEALSPELKDRFNLGTWFFDLPTKQEAAAVWNVWIKKLNIKSPIPDEVEDWTPRNIHDCCALARRLNCSLEKASKYIVPVIRSAPQTIEALRKQADGKYLSASKEGIYVRPRGSNKEKEDIRAIDVRGGEA